MSNDTISLNRLKIFSGSALKLIAVITMLIDHIALVLFPSLEFTFTPLITLGSTEITLYYIFRKIGRLAFPIFCFLITEGYIHTRNKRKYGINLLLFAIISEIPYNFIYSGKFYCFSKANVFFTLLLGYTALYLIDNLKGNLKRFICIAALALTALLFHTDYGYKGVALIVLIYISRNKKDLQAVLALPMLSGGIAAWCAFVPINMYNGNRGFIKGRLLKYAFYIFYPLHIILLLLIKVIFL